MSEACGFEEASHILEGLNYDVVVLDVRLVDEETF